MFEKEPTKRFMFTYYNDLEAGSEFPVTTNIQVTHTYEDDSTWDVVLEDFIKFLGHAWGYDISDKVEFETMEDRVTRVFSRFKYDDEDEQTDDQTFSKEEPV